MGEEITPQRDFIMQRNCRFYRNGNSASSFRYVLTGKDSSTLVLNEIAFNAQYESSPPADRRASLDFRPRHMRTGKSFLLVSHCN